MNRLIRGILYIAAGCAGIGCAAFVLGLVIGRGTVGFEDYGSLNFVKNSAYHIITQMEDSFRNGYWFGKEENQDSNDYGVAKMLNIDAEAVTQLDIQLLCGCLEIVEADSGQIWAGVDEGRQGISAVCENGRITIRDDREGSSRREDAYIYVAVPKRTEFEKISINIDAGSVQIDESLTAADMRLKAGAGEIYAQKLETGSFSASVGTGIIEIDEGIFQGNVSLDCGVGTLAVNDASINADMDVSCGMGTVELELADGSLDANYVLSCGMGSIDIGDKSYSALAHKKQIDNGAPHTFTLNCGMGTISVDS